MKVPERDLLHADNVVAVVDDLGNVVLARRGQGNHFDGGLWNQPSYGAIVGRLADGGGQLSRRSRDVGP